MAALSRVALCARTRVVRERPEVFEVLDLKAAMQTTPLPEDVVRHVLDFVPFRYGLATCSHGCTAVTLWGASGSRRDFQGHAAEIRGMRFFPLGDRLLSWSSDGTAIVWDIASARALRVLRHGSPLRHAWALPAVGRIVTRGEDGSCMLWDLDSDNAAPPVQVIGGEELSDRMPWDVSVSPGGGLFVTWGRSARTKVWSARTGRVVCELRGHGGVVSVAKIFPGGDRVITGDSDGAAIVWDARSCEPLRKFEPKLGTALEILEVKDVAVLQQGRTVASLGVSGAIHLWRTASGEEVCRLRDGNPMDFTRARRLEASLGGERLATFNPIGTVLWNVSSCELQTWLSAWPNRTTDMVVAPGGDVVASCGGGRARIWDLGTVPGSLLEHDVPSGSIPSRGSKDRPCAVAVGLGRALDPVGFGRGLTWREASYLARGSSV